MRRERAVSLSARLAIRAWRDFRPYPVKPYRAHTETGDFLTRTRRLQGASCAQVSPGLAWRPTATQSRGAAGMQSRKRGSLFVVCRVPRLSHVKVALRVKTSSSLPGGLVVLLFNCLIACLSVRLSVVCLLIWLLACLRHLSLCWLLYRLPIVVHALSIAAAASAWGRISHRS